MCRLGGPERKIAFRKVLPLTHYIKSFGNCKIFSVDKGLTVWLTESIKRGGDIR